MNRVFLAEAAVLVHLKSVGVVLFVFHRVVVSLLALGAGKCDFYSHSFTPPVLRGAFARVFLCWLYGYMRKICT